MPSAYGHNEYIGLQSYHNVRACQNRLLYSLERLASKARNIQALVRLYRHGVRQSTDFASTISQDSAAQACYFECVSDLILGCGSIIFWVLLQGIVNISKGGLDPRTKGSPEKRKLKVVSESALNSREHQEKMHLPWIPLSNNQALMTHLSRHIDDKMRERWIAALTCRLMMLASK